MLNQPDKPPIQRFSLVFLYQMVQKYPLAFWGGLWASVITIAAVAALGLVSTGPVEEEESKPVEPMPAVTTVPESGTSPLSSFITSQPSETPLPGFTAVPEVPVAPEAPKQPEVPRWLYGAIALGFVTGTLLIALNLSRPSQRKSLKRSKPTASVRKKQPRPTQKRRPTPPKQRTENFSKPQEVPLMMTNYGMTEVTVVPPEENHPLDWGEDSLAEIMDMRRRQTLSSLLKK
ncbi:hypothetical protein [Coleofasciculus sp. FACHB-1120]|uniref:hypothetical protein n=1 Tax=Coleofasciculus sp. FACHB-1120 TaxID=2692783 RepID=UPI00168431E6|nr:hypothetical protein [Coleofasciculus sp. FACHB-1120]MBD2744728.1 hypothetical protein [Coleofasciculus sp. FACHB-1120]